MSNDTKYLVTYSADYADEFDIHGFALMTKSEYDKMLANNEQVFEESRQIEMYFGSNEYIEYTSFEDWVSDLSVEKISDDQYNAIKSAFGSTSFGTFLIPTEYCY